MFMSDLIVKLFHNCDDVDDEGDEVVVLHSVYVSSFLDKRRLHNVARALSQHLRPYIGSPSI
jgi:hypothetical protein